MADKPILFSAPMVRAILQGSKTQTRRVLKPQPHGPATQCHHVASGWALASPDGRGCTCQEVYGIRWSVGDHLWVRETVRADELPDDDVSGVRYLADDLFRPLPKTDEAVDQHFRLRCYNSTDPDLDAYKKVPAIHMPRWASRITLEVTEVRVQRLRDISAADARAEGIVVLPMQDPEDPSAWWESEPGKHQGRTPQQSYRKLWNDINGAGAWAANPWVVAVTFRRIANAS